MLAALAASTVYAQDTTQDQLVKALAGVFMVKEGGNIDAASNSMRIFQVRTIKRHCAIPRHKALLHAAGLRRRL